MRIYVHSHVNASSDERCQLFEQSVFASLDEAMAHHNEMCERYRKADEDGESWFENQYSERCSYFNCYDDEVELSLKEYDI